MTLADILAAVDNAKRQARILGSEVMDDPAGQALEALRGMGRTAVTLPVDIGDALAAVTSGGGAQRQGERVRAALQDTPLRDSGSRAGAVGEFAGPPVKGAATLASIMAGKGGPALAALMFHGTPHKFEKFALDKIGTGEGAQAYGHGLYFADHPEVAKSYAENVTKYADPRVQPMGKSPVDKELNFLIDDYFQVNHEISKPALVDFIKKAGARASDDDGLTSAVLSRVDELERSGQLALNRKGSLYTVDVPDEAIAKMLHWDKPLSEQPQVLGALQKTEWLPATEKNLANMTGAEIYQAMSRRDGSKVFIGDQSKVSEYLRGLGIPGIRYLDGGSRGAGAGTHNTVLFDDALARIVGRE